MVYSLSNPVYLSLFERFDNLILRKCAVLKVHAVNPRFVNIGDMRTGEKDHFHIMGRENGRWFFYRRVEQKMTEKEIETLKEYTEKMGMTYDIAPSTNIMRVGVPEPQGKFYNEVNNIAGCRVSPVTFQSLGDVYFCIEFPENRVEEVSDKILDYLNSDLRYRTSVIYMGPQQDGIPYLLNLYSSSGNSLHDLTLVKTRWLFNDNEAMNENEGVFQNVGEFVPKKFVDDETDELLWRLRSREVKGKAQIDMVDEDDLIVEMKVRSRFFSDFYRSVVREYCGTVFYGVKCDESGLTNYYIVEKRAQQIFLRGLQKHWNLEGRRHHFNYLLEVSDLGLNKNIADIPL